MSTKHIREYHSQCLRRSPEAAGYCPDKGGSLFYSLVHGSCTKKGFHHVTCPTKYQNAIVYKEQKVNPTSCLTQPLQSILLQNEIHDVACNLVQVTIILN